MGSITGGIGLSSCRACPNHAGCVVARPHPHAVAAALFLQFLGIEVIDLGEAYVGEGSQTG
ncbi:hypothetical protein D3C80_1476250 [compost metagenome]